MKKVLLVLIPVIISVLFFMPSKEDRILNNTILKDAKFEPKVTAIMADKTKVKAYVFEDNSNPIVAINVLFKASGNVYDKTANFLSTVLTDDKNIQETLEINGISLSYSAGVDDFFISITTPKNNINEAINIFKKTFYNPDIKHSSINKVKKQLLTQLKLQKENPQSELSLAFNKAYYGNHLYANNPLGSVEIINKTTKEDIKKYMKNAFSKENVIVSFAGYINENEAKHVIDEMFFNLPEKSNLITIDDAKPNKISEHIKREMPQNIVVMATKGVKRSSEEFYPLYVANYILGGSSLNSKLSQKIREENGLAYSVYSYLSNRDKAHNIVFGLSTSTDKYNLAMSLFNEVVSGFEVSDEELKKAKKSLIDSHNLRFVDTSKIADFLTAMQKDDLGIDFFEKRNDYIRNITIQEVREVIKKYYNIDNFSLMAIGGQ